MDNNIGHQSLKHTRGKMQARTQTPLREVTNGNAHVLSPVSAVAAKMEATSIGSPTARDDGFRAPRVPGSRKVPVRTRHSSAHNLSVSGKARRSGWISSSEGDEPSQNAAMFAAAAMEQQRAALTDMHGRRCTFSELPMRRDDDAENESQPPAVEPIKIPRLPADGVAGSRSARMRRRHEGGLPVEPFGAVADCQCITPVTLRRVLRGEFKDMFDAVHIIDCRFEYEYVGGHIGPAINHWRVDTLRCDFMDSTRNGDRECIIFHCEFSSHRGPTLYRALRDWDRRVNQHRWPKLTYEHVYLLEGGYKAFYDAFADMCKPRAYVQMTDSRFKTEMRGALASSRRDSRARANSAVWTNNPLSPESKLPEPTSLVAPASPPQTWPGPSDMMVSPVAAPVFCSSAEVTRRRELMPRASSSPSSGRFDDSPCGGNDDDDDDDELLFAELR